MDVTSHVGWWFLCCEAVPEEAAGGSSSLVMRYESERVSVCDDVSAVWVSRVRYEAVYARGLGLDAVCYRYTQLRRLSWSFVEVSPLGVF